MNYNTGDILHSHSGTKIVLGKFLSQGGEGSVFEISSPINHVAKIYHKATITRNLHYKLQYMISSPPKDPSMPSHVSIAWPTELIVNKNREFIGYYMPKINNSYSLYDLLQSQRRAALHPELNHEHIYRTAMNIASALHALHEMNYVIGDLNHNNILFNNKALCAFIDCDSMQVRTRSSEIYRCTVGVNEYLSPELLGIDLSHIIRTQQQDLFSIAVLFFKLFMQGFHPFQGRPKPDNDIDVSDVQIHNMKRNIFPYIDNPYYFIAKSAPGLDCLSPILQNLFKQAFTQPNNRPTAEQWHHAIELVEQRLVYCTNDKSHVHPIDGKCVICEVLIKSNLKQPSSNKNVKHIYVKPQNKISQPVTSSGIKSPTNKQIISVSAGFTHSLAITNTGEVIIWGEKNLIPDAKLTALTNVISINTNKFVTIVHHNSNDVTFLHHTKNNTIAHWYLNNLNLHALRSFSIQDQIGYALNKNGEFFRFGYLKAPNYNIPDELNRLLQGNIIDIQSRNNCIVLTKHGVAYEWVDADTNDYQPEFSYNFFHEIKAIAQSEHYHMMLQNSGKVSLWDRSSTNTITIPQECKTDIIAIGAGLNHFVALKSNGTLVVWGDNSLNQCNIPSNMSRIKSFSTGYNHTLAIDINGKVYAWGDNRMGQCNIPNVQ